jgi:predicted ATPase/class 3 adenylate cyclase
VSLLFSDIEGSTVLLSRLGPAYADALDGQRQVLREAWAAHGGTELGTEGDSFYVVFPTAEGAVTAAAQAQRDLAAFEWPAGEQVRVRMGIHTGSPTPHDGAYVGMDVHRAARVAGAAHGGQVLLSSATAELVKDCLPDRVTVKDLGSHLLKDIPLPERLFQLSVDGLQAKFPPPKTLGASSSLPRPATQLVGRDGELAEVTALLRSPDVRLVTLTGPGGSGKTRLAIGVAERLREQFPDGVYFVPLAAVTTADVIWTSIAEVLDVPPEGRIPPGLFDHVAHRSALFLLDNLEQIRGADTVVADLLDHAPQVVVVATSRKPLAVPGERQHPVPPLELPGELPLTEAYRSGAVQLFVQHAQAVKPSFTLTDDNVANVAEVCRRLDGLPLAIELAAARTKLLSPQALLVRLDQALDITASGTRRPTRHQTLRDTIAWSYHLLSPGQQEFFRRLGVFTGGADLDAITAVTTNILNGADPLDLVADLVDASLVTVGEDAQGEPRVAMLETIRAFAIDQLAAAGESESARLDHVRHFLNVAEVRSAQREAGAFEQQVEAANRLELEHDNMRAALSWALPSPTSGVPSPDQEQLALKLCAALTTFWVDRGYYNEGRRWTERVVSIAQAQDSVALGQCLHALSHLHKVQGDADGAYSVLLQTVALWRRLEDQGRLAHALSLLAWLERSRGDLIAARRASEEVVALSRETGDRTRLAFGLWHLAGVEADQGTFEPALELLNSALVIHQGEGNEFYVSDTLYTMACILRRMGRPEDANKQMRDVIPDLLRLSYPDVLMTTAEDYGAILADLGELHHALRLLGSAEAMRERIGAPREPVQQADIEESFAKVRATMPANDWEREYQRGRNMLVEDALTEALAAVDTSKR